MAFSSATDLLAALKNKELSSLELTDHYIERIEKFDGEINAVVVRDFEKAREAAKAADEKLASNTEVGALHGLPMTIKEAYDVKGLPTTWGVPELRRQHSAKRFCNGTASKNAGAHFMGKTNVPLNLQTFKALTKYTAPPTTPGT